MIRTCACSLCMGPREIPCREDQHAWSIIHGVPSCLRCQNAPDVDAALSPAVEL